MYKFRYLFLLNLVIALLIIFTNPSQSQTNNQSDITAPNPIEVIPNNNQSDITGPNIIEIIPGDNQSDVTNPNPIEVIPSNNQSDITAPNSIEAIPTNSSSSKVNRQGYDRLLLEATIPQAIQIQEEFQAAEIQNYLGISLYGKNITAEEIGNKLLALSQRNKKKTALLYIAATEKETLLFPVFMPSAQTSSSSLKNNRQKIQSQLDNLPALERKVSQVSRQQLIETVQQFQDEISDRFKINRNNYLIYSQQLYQWLIAPIADLLAANEVDILIFAMDEQLRSLPIAALHDGKNFLIEKYAVGLIPSFGLTDIRYVDIREKSILAMGASKFVDNNPLPAVPLELKKAIESPRNGESFLNENFTIDNFKKQNKNKSFGAIHLGTHAQFVPGDKNLSYIQFYDNKLTMSQLIQLTDELGWSFSDASPIELLILSACQTALGDPNAELGFAGLTVASGVKSALASLWDVDDLGTLALMNEFYQNISDIPIKAEALRQAQLALLKGKIAIDNGKMIASDGSEIELPPQFPKAKINFTHPYYWGSFTLIGNWN